MNKCFVKPVLNIIYRSLLLSNRFNNHKGNTLTNLSTAYRFLPATAYYSPRRKISLKKDRKEREAMFI